MSFGAEQCRALVQGQGVSNMLPPKIENLCECLNIGNQAIKDENGETRNKGTHAAGSEARDAASSQRVDQEANQEVRDASNQESDQDYNHADNEKGKQKCDCKGILGNENLQNAIMSFKECHGTETNINSALISQLKYLTKECYRTSLQKIIDSFEEKEICEVNILSLKQKGQEMLTLMNTVGGTVSGALHFVEKIKAVFSSGKHFFSELIEKFQGYQIFLPILKFFRCIFCPTRNENKEYYNEEQMQQLQEQYYRTLQTNAQLNNYLLGYHNV
ncbi:hypothetical protein POVWA1_081910 [Plasmodium ovale wallikeri]|uniref:Uncharacterized protein n=1 Tax=Plasmodium ovale wallikeri TaxID=864142 RepID=A0A1A9AMP9_PLAOA|nr:hypothetical protein POVWA1_081910 [Plasmodium ovale wallikeri]